jgi:signal transduction histidine kinase
MKTNGIINRILTILNKYPVVVAGIAIYAYYLATTVDFFEKSHDSSFSFLDFVLQFDSLIWMWVTAFVFIKLQQSRESHFAEERQRMIMQTHLEKSAIANSILKDITAQLQDTINNPLAIIRMSTEDLRSKVEKDPEGRKRLDQIDASLRRIHHAIKDVTMYESTRILDMIAEIVEVPKSRPPASDRQVLDA